MSELHSDFVEEAFVLKPIGKIHACYKERFAIPRQPLLAPSVTAEIELLTPYDNSNAIKGLEHTSHLWIQFVFHGITKPNDGQKAGATVRPPRLGGNQRVGVLATRSPFRANRLGLSVVKLKAIEMRKGKPWLIIQGGDFLDNTPVLDIKPYLPYVDALPSANCDLASEAPNTLRVVLSNAATVQLKKSEPSRWLTIMQQLIEILQQDPRPAYQTLKEDRVYGCKLWHFNVTWRYCVKDTEPRIHVINIENTTKSISDTSQFMGGDAEATLQILGAAAPDSNESKVS
jgi:tRNA-Thr(GGU) m(6)t(6)A37 methyltransferase TsaA